MYKLEQCSVNLSSLVGEVQSEQPGGQRRGSDQPENNHKSQKPTPEGEPRTQKPEDEKSDGNMKNGETITLVFGRFNPPTVGHEKLLQG